MYIRLLLLTGQGADVYNLIDKEYICIGRQNVNPKQPVLDCHVFIGHTDVPAEKRLCYFLVQHKLEYIALDQVLKLIQINDSKAQSQ